MQKSVFHGTNQLFKEFSQDKGRVPNDYFGSGVAYFTDTLDIAKGYAKAMFKKGASIGSSNNIELVYQVQLQINKLFDVDNKYTGKELTKFYSRSEQESFARGAGLLTYGVDKYDVLTKLDDGSIELTGEQVFNGLSSGNINTAKAREKLKSLGYSTLRYNGGTFTGSPKHNVYIAYYARDIRIIDHFILESPKFNIDGMDFKKIPR